MRSVSPVSYTHLDVYKRQILAAPERVSCSIGACRFSYPQDMQNLYTETDRLLYAAKRMGRACYVMGALEDSELNLIGG